MTEISEQALDARANAQGQTNTWPRIASWVASRAAR
jgi:hypothetical protein